MLHTYSKHSNNFNTFTCLSITVIRDEIMRCNINPKNNVYYILLFVGQSSELTSMDAHLKYQQNTVPPCNQSFPYHHSFQPSSAPAPPVPSFATAFWISSQYIDISYIFNFRITCRLLTWLFKTTKQLIYRQFKANFREYIASQGLWPSEINLKLWFIVI